MPESIRYVPIDKEILEVLKKHLEEQSRLELDNPDNMLFVNRAYGVPSNNAINKFLQSILKELDIQPQNITCTGNCHTYASILLSEGIDILAIANPNCQIKLDHLY